MNLWSIINLLAFDFCEDSQVLEVARYIDIVVTVLFIIVPVVLLIVAITDLVKAVTSQKDDEIKKATSLLIKKVVAAAVIFLIPVIISLLLNVIGNEYTTENGENITQSCTTLKRIFTFRIE